MYEAQSQAELQLQLSATYEVLLADTLRATAAGRLRGMGGVSLAWLEGDVHEDPEVGLNHKRYRYVVGTNPLQEACKRASGLGSIGVARLQCDGREDSEASTACGGGAQTCPE